MTEMSIRELRALCCRYDQCLRSFAEEEARRMEAYGEKFAKRVEMYKYVSCQLCVNLMGKCIQGARPDV